MISKFNRVREESKIIKAEFHQRTMSFVMGGFGLVAGLAWNDAVKSLIEYFIPLGSGSVLAKFLYAIIISMIVVIFSIYLSRLLTPKKPEDDKE